MGTQSLRALFQILNVQSLAIEMPKPVMTMSSLFSTTVFAKVLAMCRHFRDPLSLAEVTCTVNDSDGEFVITDEMLEDAYAYGQQHGAKGAIFTSPGQLLQTLRFLMHETNTGTVNHYLTCFLSPEQFSWVDFGSTTAH